MIDSASKNFMGNGTPRNGTVRQDHEKNRHTEKHKQKNHSMKHRKSTPSVCVTKDVLSVKNSPKIRHDAADSIGTHYEVTDKVLGTGNFSVVKIGVDRETGERVAVKIIDKKLVRKKPEMLLNEVDILLSVDHPGIIALKDIFDDVDKVYLVMELVTGGELFDKIVEREQFTEGQSRNIMRQLFDALKYLHSLGIVHRDLKPENLLLANEKDDIIKLADFGLSKIYTEEMMSTACGTPGYVAPEILKCEGYDKKIDIWSSGVIMYIMLCGYPPFYNENDARLFDLIMEGNYKFHSPYWDNISEQAKDLISHLLVVSPKNRLTAEKALNHQWFRVNSSEFINTPNFDEYREKLKKSSSYKKQVEMNIR